MPDEAGVHGFEEFAWRLNLPAVRTRITFGYQSALTSWVCLAVGGILVDGNPFAQEIFQQYRMIVATPNTIGVG